MLPYLPLNSNCGSKQLQLTAEMYTSSRELRTWCDRNINRVYIPEWLLEKWDITVDAIFSGTA